MKAREFVRRYVTPAGGVLERCSGDHHVFKLPNGVRLIVPMGGRQSELATGTRCKLLRLIRAATA